MAQAFEVRLIPEQGWITTVRDNVMALGRGHSVPTRETPATKRLDPELAIVQLLPAGKTVPPFVFMTGRHRRTPGSGAWGGIWERRSALPRPWRWRR